MIQELKNSYGHLFENELLEEIYFDKKESRTVKNLRKLEEEGKIDLEQYEELSNDF